MVTQGEVIRNRFHEKGDRAFRVINCQGELIGADQVLECHKDSREGNIPSCCPCG
jgi:hypothetical protein